MKYGIIRVPSTATDKVQPWVMFASRSEAEHYLRDYRQTPSGDYEWSGSKQFFNGNPFHTPMVVQHRYRIVELDA